MFNVMTVKGHDSESAIILSQNMVGNIVSETPMKTTSVRRRDVHLVRNYCGFKVPMKQTTIIAAYLKGFSK